MTRRFNEFVAVQDLELAVEKGTIYGFLGPNGCGKTTTMRMLTGLLTPSEGEVDVLGFSLPRDAEKLKYEIGYMTQSFSLYSDMTVRENLDFVARIYGLGSRARIARIDELLSAHNLDQLAGRLAGRMSGGQRQRLALAAATLHRPSLIFLDEPTSAVDPETRREFWETLFDLVDTGATVLVSTHFMDEAERCHRIAILDAGHKVADGAPNKLMDELDAQVVELEGNQLRPLRHKLIEMPEVISATQLGPRLRVMVANRIHDPIAWLRSQEIVCAVVEARLVRPSLEDVFVVSTKGGRQ
ncbi:MAG: ABC transporter ATP-binding protein [Hyphomicrobiaceae bacterium]